MGKIYKIDRICLITYKNQQKKTLHDLRCRYLAKSQMVKCNAQNKEITYVNFRGSHFKKVAFDGAKMFGCDFWGASFSHCSFRRANISDSVFMACKFEDCDFENATFNYTTIVNSNLAGCTGVDTSNGITIYRQYPEIVSSNELQEALQLLSTNKHIRKNKLLHLSGNRVNKLNIFMLQRKYKYSELPRLLVLLNNKSTKNITTYKKLELELKKIKSTI